MTAAERWGRVKDVFHTALARAPQERDAVLRDLCRSDEALRREVESLLGAHAEAGGFAETPAIAALGHPAVAAALTPGLELGPYRIVGPLDAGAMGEVYRARDRRLARDVAVKVLPAALALDAERIARLQREARLLASLNHPHIATIHNLEIANGVCALVMELIDGPTLAEQLAGRALPVKRALEIARQIADALEAAHDKGIVHRDLKPANIKFTAAGAVKVLDFGLAQALSADEHAVRAPGEAGDAPIHDGLVVGTPAYMSPEQARGERVDQRADIWAFGCVLYEMLTGRRAFGGSSLTDTLRAIAERDPDWRPLPRTLPESIRRLLRRCLERDPKRRLHHMGDARLDIEEARDAASDGPGVPPRSRIVARGLAGVAVALALGLGVLLLRVPPDAPEMRVVDIATPWTSDPAAFALSPDGRRLAYVGDYQGQPTLWVRGLDAAEARPLPGTQGARRPFWSPDGRSIGFFAFTEMKRIDADGGAPQTVTSIIAGTAAAWGAGGTILFSGRMSRTISPTPTGLLRVNVAGGGTDIATRPAAPSTGHRYPQFLPGGREYLFFAAGRAAVRGVYMGSLDSAGSTRLVASDSQGAYLAPGWLLFGRQGALLAQRFDPSRRMVTGEPVTVTDSIAFDPMTGGAAISTSASAFAYRSGRGPASRLAWFDRAGRALGTFGSLAETGVSDFALSPDGRRVMAERSLQNGTALWLLDASHQVLFTRPADERLARCPLWSPRGDRVAYAAIGDGSVQVLARAASGKDDEEPLIAFPKDAFLSDWSPDGRFLLFFAPDPTTGTDVWVLPTDTRVPRLFLGTAANEMWGQFSPDGRWIAYQSNETGRFEIYVRPFPGPGAPVPISTAGGVYARWSRDGRELFYVAPDATLMAVPIRSAPAMLAADPPVALFRTRRVGGGVNVIGLGPQYDVAPDGRFLINVEPDSSPRPITLVMHWRAPAP
jgi:hypothetical protein